MEILELHLKHFGKFTDYKLPLHAGINVISGGNETGKSTLHAFVRAMFYGLSRNRSRTLDEYQLRQPWDNPAYFAGSMRILYDQKIYRIDRNFYRKDESVSIVCETDGLAIEDTQAALHTFMAGLSETDFDNTVFIRQAQPQTSALLGEHIRDFLVNVEENGTASTDVSTAQDYLKKKRKQTENEKNARLAEIEEEIRANLQETEYLNRDLERLLEQNSTDRKAGQETASWQRVETAAQVESVGGPSGGSAADADTVVHGPDAVRLPDTEHASGPAPDYAATGKTDHTKNNGTYSSYESPEEPEEDEEPGGVLLPVLVLLSFVAAGLAFACAFITTDHRMRYVLGAGGAVFIVIALALLWKITHPVTRTERAVKRARREEFLDRHLGFRDDPDDPQLREERRRRERQVQNAVEKARKLDREEEERKERNRRLLLEKTLREQEEEDRQARAREIQELVSREQKPVTPETNSRVEMPGGAGHPTQAVTGEHDPALQRARAGGRSDILAREISSRRDSVNRLKERLEELYAGKAALASYDSELQAIDLASSRIREISGKIYHESGDQFLDAVSTLLAGLTEGRYNSISLDERMQVKINTPDYLLGIDQVSYGTMNQIYFALRLAAAQLLSGGADLPVLLDEPFAMYDEERLESALRYLAGSGQQVILFSCQKRELEMLAKIKAG